MYISFDLRRVEDIVWLAIKKTLTFSLYLPYLCLLVLKSHQKAKTKKKTNKHKYTDKYVLN